MKIFGIIINLEKVIIIEGNNDNNDVKNEEFLKSNNLEEMISKINLEEIKIKLNLLILLRTY